MNEKRESFDIGYQKDQIVPHDELCKKVQCGCMGGIRYSTVNNVLLLFVSNSKQYLNYWDGDTLYYMGMGGGNQPPYNLYHAGNRRLAESREKNTTVFLIERDSSQNYKYCGEVKLCGEPFYKEIINNRGVKINALYFPLKYV